MSAEVVIPANLSVAMVEAKEKELAERRAAIRARQNVIPSSFEPEPNFPPRFLCVKPQVYHNIKEQVPVDLQRFMYILCGLYISLMIMVVYNIVCAICSFAALGSAMHLGISFLYLLGIPGGFIVWYFNAYSAATKNSRPRYLLAYVGLFIAVTFDVWMAIGISGMGGCGFIMCFQITSSTIPFILCMICAVVWAVHGVFMVFMLIRFWRYVAKLPENSLYRRNDI